MNDERRIDRLDRHAGCFEGHRKPDVPPRVTDSKTEIARWKNGGVEKERVESPKHGFERAVVAVEPMREGGFPDKVPGEVVSKIRVGHKAAIGIDDASELDRLGADRSDDVTDQRFTVAR